MAKLYLLLGVAVALLVGLLALFSSLSPREFEVNYTLSVIFRSPEGVEKFDLGWMVVGLGRENYTMAVIRHSGVEIEVFDATEGGKEYSSICALGRCVKDPSVRGEVDLRNIKVKDVGVVGRCRHLGYEGEIYRGEGVFDLGMLSEVAKSQVVELNATVSGELCVAGDLVLWAREVYMFSADGKKMSLEVVINASKIGAYSVERYREILQKAKTG